MQQSEQGMLRVATFNLRRDGLWPGRNRWEARKSLIARMILESGASVVGVQELLPHMREDLLGRLAGFGSWGESRMKHQTGEHSDILVDTRQWNTVSHRTFWLSKRPEQAASRAYFAFFPRICTMCQLTHLQTGQSLRVFNTHFDHICGPARMLGARTILGVLEELQRQEPLPTVIMGDLNARPTSAAVRLLSENRHGIGGLRLTDACLAAESIKRPPVSFHHFKGGEKGTRLDYIFVSDQLQVVDCFLDRRGSRGAFPSDHYPIVAALRFKDTKS